jgi:hypothetical protein
VEEDHGAIDTPFAGVARRVVLCAAPSSGITSVPFTGGGPRAHTGKALTTAVATRTPLRSQWTLDGHGAARWPASTATEARAMTSNDCAYAADDEP